MLRSGASAPRSRGYTVMGRVSLLIGRFNFLVNDWLRPLL